jgi:hypothetical protein
MDRTIQQHIDDDRNELDAETISAQRRRHLQDELSSLEKYQENHPNIDHDPTSLELYCDENPNALECRIYED